MVALSTVGEMVVPCGTMIPCGTIPIQKWSVRETAPKGLSPMAFHCQYFAQAATIIC